MSEPLTPAPLPLGEPVEWMPATRPRRIALHGAHVIVRPIDAARDAQALYAASHAPTGDESIWTYLPDGPYRSVEHLAEMLAWAQAAGGHVYFAIVPRATGAPAGFVSYLRAEPDMGSIEIGHIWFGPTLKRTTAATEAIFLLCAYAFDVLGYRRLEWRCNALNAASRAAAQRFGFTFEGVFRSHQVVKGRNRDTAWFAITEGEWPKVKAGFDRWLAPESFDAAGRQRRTLGDCRQTATDGPEAAA